MIKIFIGYDTKEEIAYNVLSYSIIKNSSAPVSITPIYLGNLKKYFWRTPNEISSTEFSFSRFLTPFLCGYTGWALFMDCDMLMLGDVAELWEMRREQYSLMVCKHDYNPKSEKKFLNNIQTKYEKKNWSSFMLMNCEKCKDLTVSYVNEASGLELHQFKWLDSDEEIGSIPLEWNWLAGEYEKIIKPKNIHFTLGGPWFREYSHSDYNEIWLDYYHKNTLKYDR